jgi:methanogenic corrinoid protein MtbC1
LKKIDTPKFFFIDEVEEQKATIVIATTRATTTPSIQKNTLSLQQ